MPIPILAKAYPATASFRADFFGRPPFLPFARAASDFLLLFTLPPIWPRATAAELWGGRKQFVVFGANIEGEFPAKSDSFESWMVAHLLVYHERRGGKF